MTESSGATPEQLRKIAELQASVSKLQMELAQVTEEVHSGSAELSMDDLEVKISELRDHELMSRPVNHVGH